MQQLQNVIVLPVAIAYAVAASSDNKDAPTKLNKD
jgi:hypothetical protein